MSDHEQDGDVPDLVSSFTTSTSSASSDPDFSGEWRAVSHHNLEALLRAQGVPERNIPAALTASASIRQSIRHTRHHFRVTVDGYTTTYLITAGQAPAAEDEEEEDDTSDFTPDQLLTASTMEWVRTDGGEGSGVRAKKLIVSSGSVGSASERRMVGGRMEVVVELGGARATSVFQRSDDLRRTTEEERKEKSRAEQHT